MTNKKFSNSRMSDNPATQENIPTNTSAETSMFKAANEELKRLVCSLEKQLAWALVAEDAEKKIMVERLIHDMLTDQPNYFSQIKFNDSFDEAAKK